MDLTKRDADGWMGDPEAHDDQYKMTGNEKGLTFEEWRALKNDGFLGDAK